MSEAPVGFEPNGSYDDEVRLAQLETKVAVLREEHDTLSERFQADHELLRALEKSLERTLSRIESKIDSLTGIDVRVRELETWRSLIKGRWWGVMGIIGFALTLAAGIAIAVGSEWAKPRLFPSQAARPEAPAYVQPGR